jgi:hypothetical protein
MALLGRAGVASEPGWPRPPSCSSSTACCPAYTCVLTFSPLAPDALVVRRAGGRGGCAGPAAVVPAARGGAAGAWQPARICGRGRRQGGAGWATRFMMHW